MTAGLVGRSKAKFIHKMFHDASGEYDATSTAIALKMDGKWRDFASSLVNGTGGRVLDICCGTGELSWRLASENNKHIIAMDFCNAMVEVARKKKGSQGVDFGVGDIEKLPLKDETFSYVTVAFALRNVSSIEKSILEMRRVLKKGGKIIILDLGKPKSRFFKKIYYIYFYKVAPVIGKILSKNGSYAYTYLPNSLTNFPAQDGIKKMLEELEFKEIKVHNLTKGIVAVHEGTKS